MTRSKPTRLSPPSKTAAAIAFERAALGMRRPWWTTVAASVLLFGGNQLSVNAASKVLPKGTQIWEASGTSKYEPVVETGSHLRLSNGPSTPPIPDERVVGTDGKITILGGQLSGVDQTNTLLVPVVLVADNPITIGGTAPVSAVFGQKGDLGLTLTNVELNQSVSLVIASDVEITKLPNSGTNPTTTQRIVTASGGDGVLTVAGTDTGHKISFQVNGGKLSLDGINGHVGDTTLNSGRLIVVNSAALGDTNNKLVLLGGQLGGDLTDAKTEIATDTTAARVNLLGGSVLGEVSIKKAGATIVVDSSSVATLAKKVSGDGSLEKQGPGRLELVDTDNDYKGNTRLVGGEIEIRDPGNLGAPASKLEFLGGTLVTPGAIDLGDRFADVARDQLAKIEVFIDSLVLDRPIKGDGGLELVFGELELTGANGANTYRGETIVGNGISTAKLTVAKLEHIAASSEIRIKDQATLFTSDDSKFNPNQAILVGKGGKIEVKIAAAADAASADIRVELEDWSSTAKPVVIDTTDKVEGLRLKVRVAGMSGASELLPGQSRVAVAPQRLTVADYAENPTGGVNVPTGDDAQLKFLNPVFRVVTNNDRDGVTVQRVDYGEFGAGSNGRALGHYFSQHLTGTTTPHDKFGVLHQEMDNADDDPEITNILRQLSPGAYGELARLQLRRAMAITDAIDDRIDSLTVRNMDAPKVSMGVQSQTASSTGTAPTGNHESESKWSAWASTYANSARMGASADSGLGSVRERSMGSTFGVEHYSGSAVVGLFGATAWGKSQFQDPSVNVSNDSWHIGLYTVAPIGNVTWEGSFIYGLTSNDSQRSVNLPVALGGGDYRAKFDSRDLLISTGVAINLTEPESAFQTAPVLRLSYANTQQGAVNEAPQNGATGAYAANVDSVSNSSFLSKLGWKFSYATGGKDVAFRADASSYWQHDWSGGATTTNARLAGGPGINFPVSSRGSATDSVLLNAGLQLLFNERYTTRVSINQELGGLSNETIGRATVGVNF